MQSIFQRFPAAGEKPELATLAATFGLYQRSAGLEGRFDVFVSGRKTPVSENEARQVAPAAKALGRSHLQTPAGSTLRLLAG